AKKKLVVVVSEKTGAPKGPGQPGQVPQPGQFTKGPGQPGQPSKGAGAAPGKAPEGKKTEGEGKGTEGEGKGTGGSKYGWLGLLHLPSWVNAILEKALEAFEDGDEFQALRDLLQTLWDLKDHIGEIQSWFTDTDKLLGVALGVEENAAIALGENWVNKPATTRKLVTSDDEKKGLIALAFKVLALLEKVRKVLKPVFNARAVFLQILAEIAALLDELPVLNELLDLRQAKAPPGKGEL